MSNLTDKLGCAGVTGAVAGGCAGAGVFIWAWVEFAWPAMLANPQVGVIPAWLITLLGPGEAACVTATGGGACIGAGLAVGLFSCATSDCSRSSKLTAGQDREPTYETSETPPQVAPQMN